jgi:hypothetical protein
MPTVSRVRRRPSRVRLTIGSVNTVGVRDEHQLAVEVPEPGHAQVDVLDGPGEPVGLDLLARQERLAEQDQQPGDEVLEDVLQRERQRETGQPEPGQRGADLDTDQRQGEEEHEQDEQDPQQVADQPLHRHVRPRPAEPGLGPAHRVADGEQARRRGRRSRSRSAAAER